MLKAIETRYNGYRFRSRLEARWAVFFDTLGVRYEYEPEGFDLDGLWYLPDFWLPESQHEYFVEIKPTYPDANAKEKCRRLAAHSRKLTLLLYGGEFALPTVRLSVANGIVTGTESSDGLHAIGFWDDGSESALPINRLFTPSVSHPILSPLYELAFRNALAAARSARFER